MPSTNDLRFLGAILAMSGIMLGAFGAHALKGTLAPPLQEVWHTAVEYQLWNAMGLIGLAGWEPVFQRPGRLIALGVLIFSGSLYTLALSNLHWLGAVTPLGGLCLLGGWGWVALKTWCHRK
jgi:Uncharacterized small membrane protein